MLLNVSERGLKRSGSEASAMEQRGRAKQRPSPVSGLNSEDFFEALPAGCSTAEAQLQMTSEELKVLGKQALGQAVQFEVLTASHVKRLSKVSRANSRCAITDAKQYRNSAPSTSAASTCEIHIAHFELDDVIYTAAYATIFARLEQPSSPLTVS